MEPTGRTMKGGRFVLAKLGGLDRSRGDFADSNCDRCGLPDWVSEKFGWVLQTVLRPIRTAGFVVLPKQ